MSDPSVLSELSPVLRSSMVSGDTPRIPKPARSLHFSADVNDRPGSSTSALHDHKSVTTPSSSGRPEEDGEGSDSGSGYEESIVDSEVTWDLVPRQTPEEYCRENFGFTGSLSPFSHPALAKDASNPNKYNFKSVMKAKRQTRLDALAEMEMKRQAEIWRKKEARRLSNSKASKGPTTPTNALPRGSFSDGELRVGSPDSLAAQSPTARRSTVVLSPLARARQGDSPDDESQFSVFDVKSDLMASLMDDENGNHESVDLSTSMRKGTLTRTPTFNRKSSLGSSARLSSADLTKFRRQSSVLGSPLARGKRPPPPPRSITPFYNVTHNQVNTMGKDLDALAVRTENRVVDSRKKSKQALTRAATIKSLVKMHRPVVQSSVKKEAKSVGTAKSNAVMAQYYRILWKWSIGRVLADVQEKKQFIASQAKKEMLNLRRQRQEEALIAENDKRCIAAATLFGEVMRRLRQGKSLRRYVLTEERYFALKEQFQEVCGSKTRELNLSLKEIRSLLENSKHQLDYTVFKKIDKDHSGYVDIAELCHILYPAFSINEIRNLIKKWDAPTDIKDEQQLRQEDQRRLSEESLAIIRQAFRQCDRGKKGVLVRSDLNIAVPTVEWQEKLNLDGYFPTKTSVLTFDDFVDIMKTGFPPFNDSDRRMIRSTGPIRTNNPFPKELLELQDKMTSAK